jgi:3-oxoacyl-[acyl-carrier protein] reductase
MAKGTAFITGAGQGIGRGIALALARAGFDIAANDIAGDPNNREKGLYEVKERVDEIGRTFLPVVGDISKEDDQKRMLAETLDAFGSVEVLVNNAGVAPKVRADMLEMAPESYDRLMTINARGPFFLTQAFANQMRKQREAAPETHPVIIFITSISACVASPSRAEYCISKAALSAAATNFAARLAEDGVLVYEVRPGIIMTDMTSVVKEKYDKLLAEGLAPQKRWGQPEDIGRACAALASGDFAYSTGAVIEVSGGMNVPVL